MSHEEALQEIKRLKEENAHLTWRNEDKDQLISDLADALQDWETAEGVPVGEDLKARVRAVLPDREWL